MQFHPIDDLFYRFVIENDRPLLKQMIKHFDGFRFFFYAKRLICRISIFLGYILSISDTFIELFEHFKYFININCLNLSSKFPFS